LEENNIQEIVWSDKSDWIYNPKQDRSREKMERVLISAMTLFSELGYEEATISLISRHAEVSSASIYRRFADKSSLLYAILDTWSRARTRDFDKSWHTLTEGVSDPARIVSIYIEIVFSAYRNDSGLLRLIEGRSISDETVKNILSGMIRHSAICFYNKINDVIPKEERGDLRDFVSSSTIVLTGAIRSLMLWGAMTPWQDVTIFSDKFKDFVKSSLISRFSRT
jgi:AcrR family transcriptional regulator